MTSQRQRVGTVDSPRSSIHLAVITELGHPVTDRDFPSTTGGYRRAIAWLIEHGPLQAVRIEGSSSYGVGVAAAVTRAGSRSSRSTGPAPPSRAAKALQLAIHAQLPTTEDVTIQDFETTAEDGATLLLRWYTKNGSAPGSAVLYAHGGGMILSNVAIYDGPVARYVSATAFLSCRWSIGTRPSSQHRRP